ncbi:MAG: STAS domain-containing protein [Fibrobacter sp.]|jgi:anti-sigma B factor antagonist|nr:STAS domain-containing protein [Fibrobacter sp.]
MQINKTKENDCLTIALEGRLDTLTAPQLDAELQGAYEGVKSLVFDFAQLAYISSAGLRILLTAQKAMNKQGTMVIKNAGPEIREIFDVTGFSDILTLE